MTNYSDAKYGMIPSGGITQADMWGLLNDVTTSTSQTTITSGFTRFGLSDLGRIGTGMTESSGVFSFPETGLYQIKFHAVMKAIQQIKGILDLKLCLMQMVMEALLLLRNHLVAYLILVSLLAQSKRLL